MLLIISDANILRNHETFSLFSFFNTLYLWLEMYDKCYRNGNPIIYQHVSIYMVWH